jgi:hypothetical protein
MKGKHVVIKSNGCTYSGTILTYNNWGTEQEPDRYIEFMHDEKSHGRGYGYAKEKIDGITSIEISG